MAKEKLPTLRIVLDTNIRVSALIFGGTPRKVTESLWHSDFSQVVSEVLLIEFARILEQIPKVL